ncbi:Glycosyltransferase involved in cell wall bisynthesis [Algoriphagus faecimaris]|uniref:Glycosyltransferase involved in cell wall bisynthesis n=1 Tax=Algoriphagus faecimaris TaxID=686796 RepID=A0A1G6X1A4_9BACT|nr:Glycosyltransferase involved in cell wall bisynthesis [Algoriphagus faecimaris]
MHGDKENKPIILIASGLKPIRDSRAFEKLGLSLRETNKYSLNFIGFSLKSPLNQEGIRFFSSINDTKSLLKRILMPLRFLYTLLKIRPQLVICCTWEYLPIAKLLKPILNFKLIYDVQENYIANLNLNPNLSTWRKQLAKSLIKKAERSKGIDYYLLAEAVYKKEMPLKKPYLILENKFRGNAQNKNLSIPIKKKNAGFQFVLGGTITPAFGSEEAIEWFKVIQSNYTDSVLILIGHVPLRAYLSYLREIASDNPNIIFTLSEDPIPHSELLAAYEKADFILMPYQQKDEIKSKMPTKIYEAAALKRPLLFSPNPKWKKFIYAYQGGFEIDFKKLSGASETFQQALIKDYFISDVPVEIYWESQQDDFLNLIDSL